MKFPVAQARAVPFLPEIPSSSETPEAGAMKDFFISYTAVDRSWAEWIAWELEKAGYDTVIQAWDFRPGENFVIEMQKAAAEAARTLLVLSEDYLKSSFARSEWAAAYAQDPTGDRGQLVPVRIGCCEPTGLLRGIIFIDLVGLDEPAARDTLLDGVKDERAKPTAAPRYPGSSGPAFPGTATDVAPAAALEEATDVESGFEPPPVDPVQVVVSALKTVGACAVGFLVLLVLAGYFAEGSYSRLLGLDFDGSLSSSLIVSGGQFFITLVTTGLRISMALVVVVLIGLGMHLGLQRAVPRWDPATAARRLLAQPPLLIGLQALTSTTLVGSSLMAFADLMPLAALPSQSGILSAPLDLIRRGPQLYRAAVLWASCMCLVLAGLEAWRFRLHRTVWQRRSWLKVLSLLLSFPLYLAALVELMLLPVGYGLLYLPNSRQHETNVVVFKQDSVYADLSGRTLRLLCLKEGAGRHTFFCPDPPRVWRDVDQAQLVSLGDPRKGTILMLLADFQAHGGCAVKASSTAAQP